jgi:hypothetical protein
MFQRFRDTPSSCTQAGHLRGKPADRMCCVGYWAGACVLPLRQLHGWVVAACVLPLCALCCVVLHMRGKPARPQACPAARWGCPGQLLHGCG